MNTLWNWYINTALLWQKEATLENYISCNEQNTSVVYIDINVISFMSLGLGLNIFQQVECFCSKLWLEVERAKSNLRTSLKNIKSDRFGWFVTCFPLSDYGILEGFTNFMHTIFYLFFYKGCSWQPKTLSEVCQT